jgi:hypothetical protein
MSINGRINKEIMVYRQWNGFLFNDNIEVLTIYNNIHDLEDIIQSEIRHIETKILPDLNYLKNLKKKKKLKQIKAKDRTVVTRGWEIEETGKFGQMVVE